MEETEKDILKKKLFWPNKELQLWLTTLIKADVLFSNT
jgi:hypothetical protein